MANEYYTRAHDPLTKLRSPTAELEAELDAVAAGFDKLPVIKYKTADQLVPFLAGPTLEDDDHLQGFELAAAGIYAVAGVFHMQDRDQAPLSGTNGLEFELELSQGVADDSAYAVRAVSISSSGRGHCSHVVAGETLMRGQVLGVDESRGAHIELNGYVFANATLASTLKLKWAPSTATIDGIDMYAGSWMSIEKLN